MKDWLRRNPQAPPTSGKKRQWLLHLKDGVTLLHGTDVWCRFFDTGSYVAGLSAKFPPKDGIYIATTKWRDIRSIDPAAWDFKPVAIIDDLRWLMTKQELHALIDDDRTSWSPSLKLVLIDMETFGAEGRTRAAPSQDGDNDAD